MVLFRLHTLEQIDENIARLLEQEENSFRASSSRFNTRNSNTVSHGQETFLCWHFFPGFFRFDEFECETNHYQTWMCSFYNLHLKRIWL